MPHEAIQNLREKLQRREKNVRGKRRARSRRIERAREAKAGAEATATEASGLADDAKQLLATELGVSESRSESIITRGAAVLDEATEGADDFDQDGDGDSDILTAVDPTDIDEPGAGGGGAGAVVDPAEPVMDFGAVATPEFDDVDVEEPIDDHL